MKKICIVLLALIPVTSFAHGGVFTQSKNSRDIEVSFEQVIDVSIIENFDVEAAVSCDPGVPSCQKKIADLQNLIVVLLQQIIALQEVNLEVGEPDQESSYFLNDVYVKEYQDIPDLTPGKRKSFSIRDGEVRVDEDDHAYYREISRLITEIIPESIFDDFSRITFVNSKNVYYAAQVRQSVESRNGVQSEEWELYINMDDVTLENEKKYNQSVQTLVHEAGHALLTNASQLDFFTVERSCDNLYIEDLRSCAKDDSYYATLSTYWSESYKEWTEEYEELFEEDQDEAEERLEEYYEDNEDDFITEYAASSIHEDAAETIAFYATEKIPTGLLNIAEEKIVSLFDFKEMRDLKKRVQALLQ